MSKSKLSVGMCVRVRVFCFLLFKNCLSVCCNYINYRILIFLFCHILTDSQLGHFSFTVGELGWQFGINTDEAQ